MTTPHATAALLFDIDLGAVEWFRYGDFAGWVIEGVA